MKKPFINPTLASKLLLGLFIGTVGFNAAACGRWDVICKTKAAANSVAKVATDSGNAVASTATSAGNTVASTATSAGNTVAATATSTANTVAATADQLAKQGAAISAAEAKTLINGAKTAYSASATEMTNGYNASVNQFKSLLNDALTAVWRTAGKKVVNDSKTLIVGMKHRAQNLDAAGQAALNRVKRAISANHIDEQARADIHALTKAIVYGGNDIASSVTHSSFGIQTCDSVGAGNVGGETCYMMIMQTYLENGKYKVGLARSFGVAASPYPSDVGVASTFGIFWGPGGIDENTGPSIGLGLGVMLEEGLEIGMSWGVPTTIPDPSSVIPSFSISIGVGAKGEAALTAGYTKVLTKL